MRRSIFGLCVVAAGLMAGCGTTPALQSTGERELTHSRAMAALADFKSTDPSLQGLLDRAHAYAIFPSIVSAARSGARREATWADHQVVPSGTGRWMNTPRLAKVMLNVPGSPWIPSETPETLERPA